MVMFQFPSTDIGSPLKRRLKNRNGFAIKTAWLFAIAHSGGAGVPRMTAIRLIARPHQAIEAASNAIMANAIVAVPHVWRRRRQRESFPAGSAENLNALAAGFARFKPPRASNAGKS
jgi:hypothetical protein